MYESSAICSRTVPALVRSELRMESIAAEATDYLLRSGLVTLLREKSGHNGRLLHPDSVYGLPDQDVLAAMATRLTAMIRRKPIRFGPCNVMWGGMQLSGLHWKEPRPKWEVLSVLNYVVLTIFLTSLTFTVLNYRRYFVNDEISGTSAHSVFPMLVLWVHLYG